MPIQQQRKSYPVHRQLAMPARYIITCVFEKLLVICLITASVCTSIDPDWLLNGMQAILRVLFYGLKSSRYGVNVNMS